jgi:hypothetical protein
MTNETFMQTAGRPAISRKRWNGRTISGFTISGLATAFLLMDAVMKVMKPAFVVEATVKLGYPESQIVGIGVALTACTLLYVMPRTSMLGAILLTGYLGGATASGLRAEQGWFNVAFPVVFGILIWGGVWLRDDRLRQLVPLEKE